MPSQCEVKDNAMLNTKNRQRCCNSKGIYRRHRMAFCWDEIPCGYDFARGQIGSGLISTKYVDGVLTKYFACKNLAYTLHLLVK